MKLSLKIFTTLLVFIPILGFSMNRSKIGDELVREFAKQVSKSKKWKLHVTGGSFYNPKKIVVSLGFIIDGRKTKAEIREIIIDTTEKLIDFIKSKNKYKKIFQETELNYINIHLDLTFNYADNGDLNQNIFDHVFSYDGRIVYCARKIGSLTRIENEVENYEQARAIVMQEKCDQENVKKRDQ